MAFMLNMLNALCTIRVWVYDVQYRVCTYIGACGAIAWFAEMCEIGAMLLVKDSRSIYGMIENGLENEAKIKKYHGMVTELRDDQWRYRKHSLRIEQCKRWTRNNRYA